jgi:hypothetical protein
MFSMLNLFSLFAVGLSLTFVDDELLIDEGSNFGD